jgi:hypothetical protein
LVAFDAINGIGVEWSNPTKADIAISVSLYNDNMGEWQLAVPLYYSNRESVINVFRGMEMEVTKTYRFEFLDRWKNYSTYRDFDLTPALEVPIHSRDTLTNAPIWSRYAHDSTYNDKRWYLYRGEVVDYLPFNECMDLSWSNTMGWDAGAEPAQYITGVTSSRGTAAYPLYFTMDMGVPAFFSSMVYHFRPRSPTGSSDFPVDFEIWGSMDPPKHPSEIGDGSEMANIEYWTSWNTAYGFNNEEGFIIINGKDTWKNDGWYKLGTFWYELPSGVHKGTGWPTSELSAEDQEVINAGYVYTFDPAAAAIPVRYLRWVVNEDSKDARKFTILELEFNGLYYQ